MLTLSLLPPPPTRLAESMLQRGSTDDEKLELEARLNAQKAMAKRLSTFPAPVTLPEGVTLRDDVLTKTVAFLEKMPKLT